MSTTTRRSNGSRTHEDHSPNSRQIEREIARTRHDMDETLNEIGERLHPRHLLDQVLDLFRSDDGKAKRDEYARGAKDVGKQVLREARKHPVPLLLCGAGLAWLAYEELTRDEDAERWRELDGYSEPHAAVGPSGPYTGSAGSEWRSVAWSKDFDWSGAEEDEETWTARAQRTIDEMKASIGDTSVTARDRLKAIAAKTYALSGRKRKDLHAQWASLKEHSGSFVDARTGEPYDDTYGNDVRALLACDYCATAEWSDEDEPGMSEKAHGVLEDIRATLAQGGTSAKDSLRAVSSKIGEFVGGTRETATGFGHHIAEAGRRFGHQASHTWDRARHSSARMGRQLGDRVKEGAATGRDAFAHAVDEAPLAVGAAFLGLGLIAGLALPRTRAEDEWMGEASDEFKDRARHAGEEIVERGQHVAQATVSATAEEAKRQGLTAEQLGEKLAKSIDKVERVAERAADEASRETQHEAEEVVQQAGGTSGQKQRTEQASGQIQREDARRM